MRQSAGSTTSSSSRLFEPQFTNLLKEGLGLARECYPQTTLLERIPHKSPGGPAGNGGAAARGREPTHHTPPPPPRLGGAKVPEGPGSTAGLTAGTPNASDFKVQTSHLKGATGSLRGALWGSGKTLCRVPRSDRCEPGRPRTPGSEFPGQIFPTKQEIQIFP